MNSIFELCNNNNINIEKFEYINNNIVIISDNKKYLIKKKNNKELELFKYFESINYNYYLNIIDSNNDYILCNYYDNNSEILEDKMIEVISSLHLKTMHTKEINSELLYKDISDKIDNLMTYYLELQDYIEEFSFPRLDYYFLITNISLFYKILSFSKEKLDIWYKDKVNSMRYSINIGNVSLDNFRYGEEIYFIDYSNYKDDIFIYDLVELYKNSSNIDLYRSKVKMSLDEINLFYSLICIPERITFSDDIYKNIRNIRKNIDYILRTLDYLSKENEKDHKTD